MVDVGQDNLGQGGNGNNLLSGSSNPDIVTPAKTQNKRDRQRMQREAGLAAQNDPNRPKNSGGFGKMVESEKQWKDYNRGQGPKPEGSSQSSQSASQSGSQVSGQPSSQGSKQVGGAGQEMMDNEKKRALRQARSGSGENASAPVDFKGRDETLGQMKGDLSDEQSRLYGRHFRQDSRSQKARSREFGLQDQMLQNKQAIAGNLKSINANREWAGRYDKIANETQDSGKKNKAQQKKQELLDKNKKLFEHNKALNQANKDLKGKLNKAQMQKSAAGLVLGFFLDTKTLVLLALIVNIIVDLIGILSVQTVSWLDWILDILVFVGNGAVAGVLVKRLHLPSLAAYGVPVVVGFLEIIPIVGILPLWTIMAAGALQWLIIAELKEHFQEQKEHLQELQDQREEEHQARYNAHQQRLAAKSSE